MKIHYTNAFHMIYTPDTNISLLDVRYGNPPTEEQIRLYKLQKEMEENSSQFHIGNHYGLYQCDYPDYRVYSIVNQCSYYL